MVSLCIESSSPTGISPLEVLVDSDDVGFFVGVEVLDMIVEFFATAYLFGVDGNDLLLRQKSVKHCEL